MRVFVFGAGKVGRALSAAARRAGHAVTLSPSRGGLPREPPRAALWLLAVRDPELASLAADLCAAGLVRRGEVVVHLAGALSPEVLAPLRSCCAGVGQLHPLLSFASPGAPPALAGAHALVTGDAAAVRRASRFAVSLGMRPHHWPELDRAAYHAAVAVLANGSVALAEVAVHALGAAGLGPSDAARVLGPLLGSVARNLEHLGLPAALTGPIRRGDAAAVARHVAVSTTLSPADRALFLASAEVQLTMARALGDAEGLAFDAVAEVLRAARTRG